jgi:hypothetical protein
MLRSVSWKVTTGITEGHDRLYGNNELAGGRVVWADSW